MKSILLALFLFCLITVSANAQEVQASQLATIMNPHGAVKVFIKGENGVLKEISRIVLLEGEKELLPDNPADPDKIVIEMVTP